MEEYFIIILNFITIMLFLVIFLFKLYISCGYLLEHCNTTVIIPFGGLS